MHCTVVHRSKNNIKSNSIYELDQSHCNALFFIYAYSEFDCQFSDCKIILNETFCLQIFMVSPRKKIVIH